MKTDDFPFKEALKYGVPIVVIWAVAWWYDDLLSVAICFGVVAALVVAYFSLGALLMVDSGEMNGSRKPWIVILVFACLAALSPVVFIASRWHHRSQPEYVLEKIDHVRTREDVQREVDYLTPQGKDVLLWAIEQKSDEPMTNSKSVYAEPIIDGNMCDIGVQLKDGAGTIRLLKADHWRFHDFYIAKSQGKDIGLWISYAKDHPYATAWTLFWK